MKYTTKKVAEPPHEEWDVFLDEKLIAQIFRGHVYGERFHASMSKLVWSGTIPPGASNTKSPEYGICFDVGPQDTFEAVLEQVKKHAERLLKWRRENA